MIDRGSGAATVVLILLAAVVSDPEGFADARRGVRQLVVGTGGRDLRGFEEREPISEFRAESTFGVLHLTLSDRGYRWAFLDEHGRALDTGSDSGH